MADIRPDPRNANRGTERGRGMLERSMRAYGAGRSVLVDRNGVLIAGNKTAEVAAELGLPVRVVETDGTELVAVRRTDLDLSRDRAAVELGIADNRVGQVSLEWDTDMLVEIGADIDLSQFWNADELATLMALQPCDDDWRDAFDSVPNGDKSPFEQMTFTVTGEQAEQIRRALGIAKSSAPFIDTGNENSNGNALARVCAAYVS
ncbi:MAG TPA: hypothetical protein PK478_01945 [Nitrospira sp.]|nr:hypothetical protein [Nitrospira sp.]HQW88579.1 hypothetical protein [Nitrospira sp.]